MTNSQDTQKPATAPASSPATPQQNQSDNKPHQNQGDNKPAPAQQQK